MQICSVGIDLAKTSFHLVALGTPARCSLRKVHTEAVAFGGSHDVSRQRQCIPAEIPWGLCPCSAELTLKPSNLDLAQCALPPLAESYTEPFVVLAALVRST